MAFDIKLADRIRNYLSNFPALRVEEKKMFGGLAFIVNKKMCINVSDENLMCRFDPQLQEMVLKKQGVEKMIMKGRELNGYCYVEPASFQTEKEFKFWVDLCLDYNEKAKSSK
jgi:TfoX/Sxy family transcriptional regulator of competence genes